MTEQAPAKIWSGIDIPKTIAGTLAAVSAAVVGSYLGVAGTLIGAAVASLIGSVGTELYARFIHRGSTSIKSAFVTAPAAVGTPPVAAAEQEVPSEEPVPATPVQMRWGRIVAAAGAFFVLAIGALTTFELINGRTVADAVGVRTSSSTTLGSAIKGDNGKREATTTPTESPSAEPTGEPTDGPSAEPTDGPSTEPTESPAPTGTTEPTQPTDPQQTDGTEPAPEPTDQPTDQPTDGSDQQDGTTQDGSTQQDQQQSGE